MLWQEANIRRICFLLLLNEHRLDPMGENDRRATWKGWMKEGDWGREERQTKNQMFRREEHECDWVRSVPRNWVWERKNEKELDVAREDCMAWGEVCRRWEFQIVSSKLCRQNNIIFKEAYTQNWQTRKIRSEIRHWIGAFRSDKQQTVSTSQPNNHENKRHSQVIKLHKSTFLNIELCMDANKSLSVSAPCEIKEWIRQQQ